MSRKHQLPCHDMPRCIMSCYHLDSGRSSVVPIVSLLHALFHFAHPTFLCPAPSGLYSVLCCAVLCCTLPCCAVLCCAVLC